MAQSDFPGGTFRFFPRWSLWACQGRGGGGGGLAKAGGGGGEPPPAVYGPSHKSLGSPLHTEGTVHIVPRVPGMPSPTQKGGSGMASCNTTWDSATADAIPAAGRPEFHVQHTARAQMDPVPNTPPVPCLCLIIVKGVSCMQQSNLHHRGTGTQPPAPMPLAFHRHQPTTK